MQDKMMENFNEQTRQFFEPMRKLNSMMLDNMEKMTQQQLEAMKRYSQMGTDERMRSASEMTDPEDLRDFGARQAEVMNELSQQMLKDARAMSEMSMEFKSQLEALFAEAGQQMTDQAQKAGGSAAKSGPAKASSKSSSGNSSNKS